MKVLFFPYSAELGATQGMIKIASILQKKNVDIVFAGNGKFLETIKLHGFKTADIVEVDFATHLKHAETASMGFHTYDSILKFVEEEIKLIKEIKPDVVVDLYRPTLYLSSKITKVTRISLCNAVLTKYYALPVEVPEGHWSYDFFQISPFKKLMYPSARLIKNISFKIWVRPYNRVLKKFHLKSVKSMLDILEGDITIIMDAEEYAPIKKITPNSSVYVLGPILNDGRVTPPVWIDSLDAGKNIIYVSMGSTGSLLPKVLKDLVDLYGGNDKYQIVSNTLGLYDINKKDFPDNFFIDDYINVEPVLKKSKIFITHGGRGSIYHALFHGVPIIGIPHQPEQEWNVNRLEKLLLGKKMSRKKYDKHQLKLFIEEILTDKKYKNKVNVFSNVLKRYNGAEAAAEIIIKSKKNVKRHNYNR